MRRRNRLSSTTRVPSARVVTIPYVASLAVVAGTLRPTVVTPPRIGKRGARPLSTVATGPLIALAPDRRYAPAP
jgi:hypothetical protein